MFEAIEIVHLDAPISAMFALAIINLGLIVWMKHRFPREWRLAGWAFQNIRRIWQRGADETPRTGGVIVAHIQGVIALAIISLGCIDNLLPGLVLGVIIVMVRLSSVEIFRRFKKYSKNSSSIFLTLYKFSLFVEHCLHFLQVIMGFITTDLLFFISNPEIS